jgi:hypothetical protein
VKGEPTALPPMFFDIEACGLDAGVPIEIGCPVF